MPVRNLSLHFELYYNLLFQKLPANDLLVKNEVIILSPSQLIIEDKVIISKPYKSLRKNYRSSYAFSYAFPYGISRQDVSEQPLGKFFGAVYDWLNAYFHSESFIRSSFFKSHFERNSRHFRMSLRDMQRAGILVDNSLGAKQRARNFLEISDITLLEEKKLYDIRKKQIIINNFVKQLKFDNIKAHRSLKNLVVLYDCNQLSEDQSKNMGKLMKKTEVYEQELAIHAKNFDNFQSKYYAQSERVEDLKSETEEIYESLDEYRKHKLRENYWSNFKSHSNRSFLDKTYDFIYNRGNSNEIHKKIYWDQTIINKKLLVSNLVNEKGALYQNYLDCEKRDQDLQIKQEILISTLNEKNEVYLQNKVELEEYDQQCYQTGVDINKSKKHRELKNKLNMSWNKVKSSVVRLEKVKKSREESWNILNKHAEFLEGRIEELDGEIKELDEWVGGQ